MLEQQLLDWDGEYVVTRYCREQRAWIFIAVHSSVLGPATGGTRLKSYLTPSDGLRDAMRLAAGMTRKWAVLGFPKGGAKAVICTAEPLNQPQKRDLLLILGTLVEQLRGGFETGPDLGISSADMDVLGERTRYVFGFTPAAGGVGDPGPYTARGVLDGIRATCRFLFGSGELGQRSMLVQGVGSVGGELVGLLMEASVKDIRFSDVDPARVEHFRDGLGLTFVPPEEVYAQPVDIFAPCAVGGILNAQTIPTLKCRAVAGGANNQLEAPEDARRLKERGILYAPDFVINGGGALALPALERMGWTREQVEQGLARIGERLYDIYESARREDITTAEAADRLAEARIREAQQS